MLCNLPENCDITSRLLPTALLYGPPPALEKGRKSSRTLWSSSIGRRLSEAGHGHDVVNAGVWPVHLHLKKAASAWPEVICKASARFAEYLEHAAPDDADYLDTCAAFWESRVAAAEAVGEAAIASEASQKAAALWQRIAALAQSGCHERAQRLCEWQSRSSRSIIGLTPFGHRKPTRARPHWSGGGGSRVVRFFWRPGHISNLGNASLPSPEDPIHHPLRPRFSSSRWPPFGVQRVTDLLKRPSTSFGRFSSQLADPCQGLRLTGQGAEGLPAFASFAP